MKKLVRRFETIPLAEVLKKVVVVKGDGRAEKTGRKKDEPYAVVSTRTLREPEEASKAIARSRRVLVVDDEPCIADTLAAIFRNAGYETATAYDGNGGLSQCEVFRPDLVITDVVMPEMNGIEMAIWIKERYPTCKVLLFSGQAATANLLDEARRSGYDFELLAKPVHPAELLAKVAA